MNRADTLLLLAVLASLAIALGGILERPGALAPEAIASVNGEVLDRAAFEAYAGRVAEEFRRAPDADERAGLLARLVDEELLLQQGLALDIPRKNSRLRTQIVQEVIAQAVAEAAGAAVTEQELRDFHAANTDYFRSAPLFRVARFECRDMTLARELAAAIGNGEAPLPMAGVQRDDYLPDAWLGEAKLRDYLGATLSARIAALPQGAVIEVEPAGVLWLMQRREGHLPGFAEVRAQVEVEFRRRREEAALRAYVARLRADAQLVFAPAAD